MFAPLGTYLLEKYGWKGANIIFAALCLQCAVKFKLQFLVKKLRNIVQVFGALMRPLSVQVYVKEEEEEEEEEEKCILKLPDGTLHSQSLELGLTESQQCHTLNLNKSKRGC